MVLKARDVRTGDGGREGDSLPLVTTQGAKGNEFKLELVQNSVSGGRAVWRVMAYTSLTAPIRSKPEALSARRRKVELVAICRMRLCFMNKHAICRRWP
jgi:hypothetical protein